MTVVSDVAGDHDLKSEESTAGDFGAPHCFVLLLVLVLGAFQYSYPAYWSASSREPLRTTIGIAAARTAIEYDENNRLTRSQRRGRRYSALISCSATRPSAPAWI
jgi:hypothetical protein